MGPRPEAGPSYHGFGFLGIGLIPSTRGTRYRAEGPSELTAFRQRFLWPGQGAGASPRS